MANPNYYGRDQRPGQGQSGNIDAMAEQYIPAIRKILLFKTASTDDIKMGVEMIEKMVNNNKSVTAHQIRNVFSLIKDLEGETAEERLNDLHILRPRLAYIGARQKDNSGKIIIKVLDELIKSIDLKEGPANVLRKIEGLHYIMESIVAYHKFHSKN